jgi:hypothetical protein
MNTVARILWVLKKLTSKLTYDAKPRFVLNSDGVSYIVLEEVILRDKNPNAVGKRLTYKFDNEDELGNFLNLVQHGESVNSKKVQKFLTSEKIQFTLF